MIEKRLIEGGASERAWQKIEVDLKTFAGKTVHLRLYQRVLLPNKIAGNALWRNLRVSAVSPLGGLLPKLPEGGTPSQP